MKQTAMNKETLINSDIFLLGAFRNIKQRDHMKLNFLGWNIEVLTNINGKQVPQLSKIVCLNK